MSQWIGAPGMNSDEPTTSAARVEPTQPLIELERVGRSDARLIFESWGQEPANFERLTARVFVDIGDAERYLAHIFTNPQSVAFHLREPSGRVIGIAKAIVSEHRAQLGYVVHRPFWGRGIATEALRKLTAIARDIPGISRVWATCALDNTASVRVLEKCGYEREGVLKNWATYPALGGGAFDNYSYVSSNSNWREELAKP